MLRTILIALSTVFGLVTMPASAQDAPPRQPNIIFILADDLGWTDLGCYGSKYYETPHIDRLAAQGMRFTSGHSAGPNCTPTRAALMTGQLRDDASDSPTAAAEGKPLASSRPWIHFAPMGCGSLGRRRRTRRHHDRGFTSRDRAIRPSALPPRPRPASPATCAR